MGTDKRRDRRTGKRRIPALSSATALLVLVGSALTFLAETPAAADPIGDCTATKGAVVAVDFGPFGGPVERGCDTTPTTGYELLHEGGFGTTGTEHDGPAFICRIGSDAFDSGKQYPTPDKESCVLTPQATAYWSYWTASPGQDDWTYSQYGAMDRKLKDGDVDAWVYGGTDIGGSTGQPTFTPDDVRAGGGTTPDPGNTPTGAPGDVDLAAAAAWLKGNLTDGERIVDDGADSPNYLLTTETAYALAAADGKDAAVQKIAVFLTAHTDDYAYLAGKNEAPDATAAARLALLAEITGQDPADFGGHDLIGDLKKNVCAAGPESGEPTPGCTGKGDFQNATFADGQALSALALLRAGVTPPADTVDRLTQIQCKDGGVTSILIRPGEYCDGDPATTGLVALVLNKAGGHDDEVTKARAYLKKAQREDGSFPGYTGATTGSVAATAYAAQALRALGDTALADAATGWLSRQQLDGGGFGFEEGATDPALYPTPPAVLAGAGTSLVTLTTKTTDPTDPPTSEPPTSEPPTGPTTRPGDGPDLKKGVAYLTGATQLRQGQYYTAGGDSPHADFGLTIDGAYALAATGLNNAKLRGIVDFLDHGGKDGEGRTVQDWTGAGTPYPAGGSIGKTALLAESVGRDPRDFGGQDLIAALNKAVCAQKSTAPDRSCPAKGAYTYAPSVFSQSLAVMAQLRAGEKTSAKEPIAYLEHLQQDSGAWPSLIPSTNDSDVDSTAMAAMTLDLVGTDTADKAVDKALEWIASRQLADGGFPGAAGDSVNSAALAVQGLSLHAGSYRAEIAKALKFLAGQQNHDGGFNVAKEGQRGSDLRASTQAVGGATGISFGVLDRDLSGTSAQPTPSPSGSIPEIVTPGESGGSGDGTDTAGGTGGGVLASTGVQVGALAGIALVLVLAGWRTVVVARRRAESGGRS
ncbi:prenyltransferase/squalene oxidase repeat-containing protein [Streptomyces sp. NPDC048643]|uniref:prenyltransferase/squalene oxidase repeat-containing protein n=1 Tax=Streptomyces sp. NPDC048643 TaxID=3155637 RepID=UPI00342898DE